MKEYFQYLIWMLLFAIVIEMFFPDSSFRKYIKLILGCILIYTMLSPVIKLIQINGKDYENYVNEYQMQLDQNTKKAQASYSENVNRQNQSVQNMYRDSIKKYVQTQFDVGVNYVDVVFKDDAIWEIEMDICKKAKKIEIGKITIGDKSSTLDGDEEDLKNKIKTCLSDFYNVQVSNIYITVQKN